MDSTISFKKTRFRGHSKYVDGIYEVFFSQKRHVSIWFTDLYAKLNTNQAILLAIISLVVWTFTYVFDVFLKSKNRNEMKNLITAYGIKCLPTKEKLA